MDTAAAISSAISAIVAERRIAAEKSEYDWKVCVGAVAAATELIRSIPVAGAADAYLRAVLDGLNRLLDGSYDPEGEYTSGKSDIGTVIAHIERLSKSVTPG